MKMTCGRIDRLISAYLDGELSGTDMMLVREHIRSCRSCENDLESERRMKRTLGGLSPAQLSTGFEARLIAALNESRMPWHQRVQHWIEMHLSGHIEPGRATVFGCAALLLAVLGHLPQGVQWNQALPTQPASFEAAFSVPATTSPMLKSVNLATDTRTQASNPWQQTEQYGNHSNFSSMPILYEVGR